MRATILLALLFGGCVSDRTVAIELRPPRAPDGGPEVPADVVSIEVRLVRLEEDAACATVEEAAAAIEPGRLAHVQRFAATDGMGMTIGEVPSGRWSVSALARDGDCAVRLYGCAEVVIDGDVGDVVVVDVAPASAAATCGSCRACEAGGCDPIDVRCE